MEHRPIVSEALLRKQKQKELERELQASLVVTEVPEVVGAPVKKTRRKSTKVVD